MEFFLGLALFILVLRMTPALVRRVSGRAVDSDELRKRLDDTEQRLAKSEERLRGLAEGTHERLVDIEERLDFAERVLQQQREARRLPGADR